MERRLIAEYEGEVEELLLRLTPNTHSLAVAIAKLPQSVRGFGHIKLASVEQAHKQRSELFAAMRKGEQGAPEAPARKPVPNDERAGEEAVV
jgi:indolepyruvate ferredoxin oxidoreductase